MCLWCIYYLQGAIYPTGAIIAKVALMIVLLLSFMYMIRLFRNNISLPPYFRGLIALLVIIIIYQLFRFGTVVYFEGVVKPSTDFIKNVLISTLPIFSFYYFAQRGYLNKSWLSRWIFVFLVLCVISFFNEKSIRIEQLIVAGSSRAEVTNNTGYLFASLIPSLFLVDKKPIVQYTLLVLCSLFAIAAMKRGAMLVTTLCIIIFIVTSLNNSSIRKKIAIIFLMFWAAFIVSNYIGNMMENSDYFQHRMMQTLEGDSSGRNDMYTEMFSYFFNQPLLYMIFGNGLDGTVLLFGDGAHNDWLEIMIDMGFIGIVFYIIYWHMFYKTWKMTKFTNRMSYIVIGVIMLSEFMKTMFSFSIYSMPIYELPALSLCIYTSNQ